MSEIPRQRTIFFCIGVAKSGTTLIARVLDQHPQIACIWESYGFHPRSGASIFNPRSDKWRQHGFFEQEVRAWAHIWRAQPQLALRRIVRKLTGRSIFVTEPFRVTMTAALATFARRCSALVAGDKWPQYTQYLKPLVNAFPKARFIYNVRDPRGLWNSAHRFKERQRGDEMLRQLLRGDKIVSPYLSQENFLTIRYEDLVCQPEETARKLYRFLGCDFSSDYLHYRQEEDAYPERWSWIPQATGPFNPWHTKKWKEQMSAEQIALITERTASFREKYGYE